MLHFDKMHHIRYIFMMIYILILDYIYLLFIIRNLLNYK